MNEPERVPDLPEAMSRRQFIGWGASAVAGLVIAPGVTLFDLAHGRPAAEAASSKVRWGMLIDTKLCGAGCNDCVAACSRENHLSGGLGPTDSQWIRKLEIKDRRSGKTHSAPMMCQHCEHPPCVDVCPTGASFRRADGIVLVDRHICIGCRYCMMACPYKARSFVHADVTGQNPDVPRGKGCVESCTLCVHRIDRDQTPACVEACAATGHSAMIFGDLNDPHSEISQRIAVYATTQVRADLALNTAVRYQGI
ncbi:MAG: sulfate reduction electron transfer complex DsrMKJOP subunit DsrO [Pseudomonadota bacterium]